MLVLLMCDAVKGADGAVKFCLSGRCQPVVCVVPEEEINHKHNS